MIIMKVYILTKNDWDYIEEIIGVFSSMKLAEEGKEKVLKSMFKEQNQIKRFSTFYHYYSKYVCIIEFPVDIM